VPPIFFGGGKNRLPQGYERFNKKRILSSKDRRYGSDYYMVTGGVPKSLVAEALIAG
jgi:hypothetical protein